MSENKRGFQKGNTLARDSKNIARKRIRRSQLRKTLEKLRELEPFALDNIEKSVKCQNIDKEALATSRWLIQQLQSVAKSASAEEQEQNLLRWKADAITREEEELEKEQEEDEEEKEPVTRFSLHVLPTKDDLN